MNAARRLSPLVRAGRVLRFAAGFGWEFLRACFEVAGVVLLTPTRRLRPGFLVYPAGELTRLEALLLSYCITLTPGTTTADYDPERGHMIVHSLGIQSDEQVRDGIKRRLHDPIMAFTR